MSVYEKISGFADEISQDFDQQLKTVTDLGMKYICIRSAEHKGIAEIIIGKQRNGPIGPVRLTFLGQYTKFDNFAGAQNFYGE